MKRKDYAQLRKRMTLENCSFTRISGCFIDSDKEIILEFNESFLTLEEEEIFKYLDISKKVLSGSLDNNLLLLDFADTELGASDKQMELIQLKKSGLRDEKQLKRFYSSIKDNYDYPENYLILVFHDVYDLMSKTKDDIELDESEEVFEYIITAICPVELSEAGLSYDKDENTIRPRMRDWIVAPPINGFLFPALRDNSSDVNSLSFYSKNTKEVQAQWIEEGLGCLTRETIKIQKDKFKSIAKDSVADNKQEAEEIYMQIQDSINEKVEIHSFQNIGEGPLELNSEDFKEILLKSGLEEKEAEELENHFKESFQEELPRAENLLEKKFVEMGQQKKKEIKMEERIEKLESKLEDIKKEKEEEKDYDIILKLRPDLLEKVESRTIDGKDYLLIPTEEGDKKSIDEI